MGVSVRVRMRVRVRAYARACVWEGEGGVAHSPNDSPSTQIGRLLQHLEGGEDIRQLHSAGCNKEGGRQPGLCRASGPATDAICSCRILRPRCVPTACAACAALCAAPDAGQSREAAADFGPPHSHTLSQVRDTWTASGNTPTRIHPPSRGVCLPLERLLDASTTQLAPPNHRTHPSTHPPTHPSIPPLPPTPTHPGASISRHRAPADFLFPMVSMYERSLSAGSSSLPSSSKSEALGWSCKLESTCLASAAAGATAGRSGAVVQCGAVQCDAVQCGMAQCSTVWCGAVQYSVGRCSTWRCSRYVHQESSKRAVEMPQPERGAWGSALVVAAGQAWGWRVHSCRQMTAAATLLYIYCI